MSTDVATPALVAADHSADRRAGTRFDVVIPTVGRSSLASIVWVIHRALPAGSRLIVVDDRPDPTPPLDLLVTDDRISVVRSGGRGPAAARNAGWRASTAPWIAFVDDDVEPPLGWVRSLTEDVHRAERPRRRGAGAGRGAAARRPGADRLGAQRRRPRRGHVDHRRHGGAPRRPRDRRRVRRTLPAAPTARTPTSRCASSTPGGRSRSGPAACATPCDRRGRGRACGSSGATPTTSCSSACTAPAGARGWGFPRAPGARTP